MRILLLADSSSPHTRKWVKGLNGRGVDLRIFSLTSTTDDLYSILDIKVDTLGLEAPGGSKFSKLSYLKGVPVVKRMIKEFNPDIIHAHYASSYGFIGALTSFHPFCLSVWGSDVYSYPGAGVIYRKIFEKTLSRTDAILSTSHHMAAETGIYTDKLIKVIPFGVDLNKFKPLIENQRKDGKVRFATAKSLSPIYNIPLCIRAFLKAKNELTDLKIELHIAGDGPQMAECLSLASDEKNRSIFFYGRLASDQMPEFYQQNDILLNVPETESFGVSPLEASASGLAVIATKRGGLPEVVSHGETALLIERPEEELLVNAMTKLATDDLMRTEMGKAGRVFVERNFDFELCLDKQIETYKEIL